MQNKSAGLLMYRRSAGRLEVFLVHPGGPFWASKDDGAWSVPKGEFSNDEDPLATAQREFEEETGFTAEGDFIPLKPLKQSSRKTVYVWAVEGDCDPLDLKKYLWISGHGSPSVRWLRAHSGCWAAHDSEVRLRRWNYRGV